MIARLGLKSFAKTRKNPAPGRSFPASTFLAYFSPSPLILTTSRSHHLHGNSVRTASVSFASRPRKGVLA